MAFSALLLVGATLTPAQAAGIQALQISSSPSQPRNYTVSNYRVHLTPPILPAADSHSPSSFASEPLKLSPLAGRVALGVAQSTPAAPDVLPVPQVVTLSFPPSDVTKTATGHVLAATTSHSIFVNCAPSFTCWGSPNPNTFLNNLSNSNFIHLTDQYAGSTANNRYPAASTVINFSYPIFAPLADSDILQIVHNSAKLTGLTGYGHIYHVFLNKGVDVCFVGTSQCYSPDNTPTFAFCGYHTSVNFSDIGHVLYTVEPYQGVNGCQGSNLKLTDSTANTLSHEMFEAISDPDPGLGFTARFTQPVLGQEIGDLCAGQRFSFAIGAATYLQQLEYSNKIHGCANGL